MNQGGRSETLPATHKVQKIVNQVKKEAQNRALEWHCRFSEFVAVSYNYQVVQGTLYFVKVHIGEQRFIHLRVFEPLPHTELPPSLQAMEINKKADSPIRYF
jgi:cystatin-A/B